MNQSDQPAPVSNPSTYKASLELIIRQFLTVEDWNKCCADIMVRYGINDDTVKRELARRARLLVWTPFLMQIGAIGVMYYLDSYAIHPAWFGSIGVEPDVAFLSLIGCFVSQLLYHLWLKHLDKPYRFLNWTTVLTIGAGVQVVLTLCVFLFFIPMLIHDVRWTPIVTIFFWQIFVILLIVYCFAMPVIMQKTALKLATSSD
jgi:hypothetical protein